MRNIINNQRGNIPLAAVLIPTIILVIALVLFSSSAPSSVTRVRGHINQLVLVAIKEYSFFVCTNKEQIAACHEEKLAQALLGVKALIDRNKKYLGETEVFLSKTKKLQTGLFLEPLRYYHDGDKATMIQSGCNTFPCLADLQRNELATAFRISGKVNMADSSVLAFAGKIFGAKQDLDLEVSAAANITPVDIVMAVDTSPSTAEYTHLNALATEDNTEPFNSSIPPEGEIKGFMAEPREEEESGSAPKPSFFSFEVAVDDFFQPIDIDSRTIWQNLDENRPFDDSELTDQHHFKSDYTDQDNPVWAWGVGYNSFNDYLAKSFHPSPEPVTSENEGKISRNVLRLSNPPPERYFFIDAMVKPEPFNSILQATKTIVSELKARQVSEDYFSMIFFSHVLPWSSIINMTNDLSYIEAILDDSITLLQPSADDNAPDYHSANNTNTPLLYQLGLFPNDRGYTDEALAYFEAAYQFQSIPGNRLSSKALIHIGDGISTCHRMLKGGDTGLFPNCDDFLTLPPPPPNCVYRPILPTQACNSSYDVYKQASSDLNLWVANNLFKAGITLNVAQFGKQAGPHYLLLPDPNDPSRCLTDGEARALDMRFVQGLPINNDNEGRAFYNNRFKVPFYQAAYDTYMRTVMTGGLYAPIMEQGQVCQDDDIAAFCSETNPKKEPKRIETSCKTTEQQLTEHFLAILENTTKFSLIDPNLTGSTSEGGKFK